MNNGSELVKKKGQKTKHLTPIEVGKIEVLLNLNLYTAKEIGDKIGRSADSVEKVAKKLGLKTIGQAKRTDEWKLKTAELVGNVASKMFQSLNDLDDKEMKKISPQGKALIGGIAVDKVMTLTKPKEDPNAQAQVVNMTWLSLVQQNLPQRAKDGPPIIEQSTEPTPAVEDAQIIKNEEKDDGSKTNE